MMQISRRRFAQFGVAAAAGLAGPRFAGAQATTTLKLVSNASWSEKITAEGIVQPFEKRNPAIKLAVERIPFNQLTQTLEIRLGARTPEPDVYVVDTPLTSSYAVRGHLLEIDSIVDKSRLTAGTLASVSYGGKMYAAPIGTTATVLFVNRAMFKSAGIEPPSPDPARRWTWKQIYDAGKKLAKPDQGIWGFAFEQSERPYMLLPLGQSLGGKALSDNGLAASGFMDSEPFVQGWTFMQSLYKDRIAPIGQFDPNVVRELFFSGKAAMLVGLTATYDGAKASGVDLGIAPFPYFENGKPVTPTGGWAFGINPRTKHADAARQFIRELVTPELQEAFIRARPYPPSETSLWSRMSDYYTGDMWNIVKYDDASTAVALSRIRRHPADRAARYSDRSRHTRHLDGRCAQGGPGAGQVQVQLDLAAREGRRLRTRHCDARACLGSIRLSLHGTIRALPVPLRADRHRHDRQLVPNQYPRRRLAGLLAIPRDVLEAADLDGAKRWQRFVYITLPLMRRPLAFVLVADTAINFLMFAPVYVITQGGPAGATQLLMFETYQTAFAYLDHGRSLAMSVVILVMILTIAAVEMTLLRQRDAT